MKKNQMGFSAIHVLLVVVVLGIASFAGWRVYESQKAAERSSSNTINASEAVRPEPKEAIKESETPWQTYSNKEVGLTFQYPSDWKHEQGKIFRSEEGEFADTSGEIISPAGNKLLWKLGYSGGSGGECKPDQGDVPFAAGNKCHSKQIISMKELPPIDRPTTHPPDTRGIFDDFVYITEAKYMRNSGELSYHVCLDAYHKDYLPVIGQRMGFLFPCEYWRSGFNARFDVKDEAGFQSEEAKIAKRIMESFNSL